LRRISFFERGWVGHECVGGGTGGGLGGRGFEGVIGDAEGRRSRAATVAPRTPSGSYSVATSHGCFNDRSVMRPSHRAERAAGQQLGMGTPFFALELVDGLQGSRDDGA